MRVLLLMSVGSPWSRKLAMRLAGLGHAVHIVDFADKRFEDSPGANGSQCRDVEALVSGVASVDRIAPHGPFKWRYVLGAAPLRRIARRRKADVMLSLHSGGFTLMAYLSGFRPYATYAVGSDVLLTRRVNRRLARRFLTAADMVFANGGYLAEQTRRMAPGAQVVPLLLGVDTEKFCPGSPPASPVHVVCTRHFAPVYNNDYLIRALAALPAGLPEFHVTFVSHGPLLASVRELADTVLSPAMRRRVEFLGGVSDAEVLAALQSAHVYASLARSDGTATSTLEALACGLYPVLSDIPQNREWIEPGSPDGLLVPLDQPERLAEALATAIGQEDRRLLAAGRNRQLILDRADSARTVATLCSLLESLVKVHEH
jgi:L-malate glycosyltransferase